MAGVTRKEETVQRRYRPPAVPLRVIRQYARQIADRFKPERIVLFGSFAYGEPHTDSDVDLLVVMPAANEISQAIRIRLALEAPFPLDLIVRTPQKLHKRLADGSWFLSEIMAKGKVLYEKRNGPLGAQGRGRPARGQTARKSKAATE